MSAEDDIHEALTHTPDGLRVEQLLNLLGLPAEEVQAILDDMWRRGFVVRTSEGLAGKEKTYKAVFPRP